MPSPRAFGSTRSRRRRATSSRFLDQHDAADILALPLGDPATLALVVVVAHEGSDDLRASAPRAARPSHSPRCRARRGGSRSSPCRRAAAAAGCRAPPVAARLAQHGLDRAHGRATGVAAPKRQGPPAWHCTSLIGMRFDAARTAARPRRSNRRARLWRRSLLRSSASRSARASRSRAGCGSDSRHRDRAPWPSSLAPSCRLPRAELVKHARFCERERAIRPSFPAARRSAACRSG